MWSLALAVVLMVALVSPGVSVRARAQETSSRAPIRLYVFDGGRLESDPSRYQLTEADVGGVTQLSVGAYLIVHPDGILMWDTGAVPDDAWTPTGAPVRQHLVLPGGQTRDVTLTQSLASQLSAAGYRPSDVTHLALSHSHWDHTANANLFRGATWLVPQAEWDVMFGGPGDGIVNSATYASLRNSRTVIVQDESYDVFGDGTVLVLRATGHTPGHQVLYVKLAETGGVVLSGDLYHYPQERTLGRLPTFEADAAATRLSRSAIEGFLRRTGAALWIQHDFTAHAALRKAPDFYR
jgi:N-acyl homoserine lactone hydrolase